MMSSKILKDIQVIEELKNWEVEIKDGEKLSPLVITVDDERLANATGRSLESSNSKLNVSRFLTPPGLPPVQAVGPTTRDETYQSDSELDKTNQKYPSLVINAALRWYEIDLEQGGIMLFDWIRGQFQVFQSMQTFKHQRTFLKLHQKNVKRLFAGMFSLLPFMTQAGIAHNNISLETIMLLKAPVSNLPEKDDLYSFIDSPPWFPLLTSFGCSSLVASYNKRAPDLKQEQFHSLFTEYCPTKLSKKVTNIILSYSRDHSNYTRYLAPEMNPVAPNGDIWSLGVLLWECLTNTFLWQKPKTKLYHHMVEKKGGFKMWFINHARNPGNSHLPYFVPEEALDLLNVTFQAEKKRISLNEILKHKFFSGINVKPARTSVDLVSHGLEIQFEMSRSKRF